MPEAFTVRRIAIAAETGRRVSTLFAIVVTLFLSIWIGLPCAEAGVPAVVQPVVDVQPDPGGGVHAHAVLDLPGSRAVVEHVLTDYEAWPQLFETEMRMGTIQRYEDRVVTELFVQHPIVPGESRLLSENRREADGRLTTVLLGGDFTRYSRSWHLSEPSTGATRAEFDLIMQPKTLAPDWVVALALRRELNTHFKRLIARIAEEAARR